MNFRTSTWNRMQQLLCTAILLTWCTTSVLSTEDVSSSNDVDENNKSQQPHSRQKRFIYFNTQSPVDIGLLITVPLSFALPTFNLQTSRRFSRSITEENELLANLTSEDILPSDTFDEPSYNFELGKMSTYFTILQIDEDICQQKVICEVFAEPEKYKPVSDIFEKKLTVDRGPIGEKHSSRYYRYVRAMQEGVAGGEAACQKEYKRCPYAAHERLNMPALHFWTYLTNILRMEFRDE
ncbi:unnamed protein product [Orchesella dallaii]|uniref:Uncharacterized protein n=1 Tax=Orchesella dallaii TaxID=48710 RepID=A0ABP1R3W2_9HEXA